MFLMFPDKAPMLGFSNKCRFAVMVKFSLTPPSNKCLNLENNGNYHFNTISTMDQFLVLKVAASSEPPGLYHASGEVARARGAGATA